MINLHAILHDERQRHALHGQVQQCNVQLLNVVSFLEMYVVNSNELVIIDSRLLRPKPTVLLHVVFLQF